MEKTLREVEMNEMTSSLTEEEIARGAEVFLFLLKIKKRIDERESSHQ